MSEVHDSEALVILRRLEPALQEIRTDIRALRQDVTDLSRSVGRIEGAMPHFALKEHVARLPGRGELWGAIAALSAIYTVVLAALPWIERHLP
jgi:hypothetical protein